MPLQSTLTLAPMMADAKNHSPEANSSEVKKGGGDR